MRDMTLGWPGGCKRWRGQPGSSVAVRETCVPSGAAAQVRGTVQRVQLDDQMPLAAHPVVLCPAGVGHESVTLDAVGALLAAAETNAAGSQGVPSSGGQQPLVRCAAVSLAPTVLYKKHLKENAQ